MPSANLLVRLLRNLWTTMIAAMSAWNGRAVLAPENLIML
jgi:hypothetical protein